METEILGPNSISAAAAYNKSGITNNQGDYDDSDDPIPIFALKNPTTDTNIKGEPDYKTEDSEDDDEDSNDDNDAVEGVKPSEKYTLDPIIIEIEN